MLDVITENIDTWSSAQIPKTSSGRGRSKNGGLTAHGVNKLRELILELAVRGKLVEQDPNDEPATELLKRIVVEKARLIKAGNIKIKTSKRLGESTELDFRIPERWISVKLAEISNVVMGQSPPGQTYNIDGNGVPLINGPVEFSEGPFGRTIVNQYTTAPTNFCNEGDFLICIRGSTTGRSNIAASKACIGRGVAAIQQLFDGRFVRFFLWRMRERIISMGRGVAFPSITRKQLEDLPIPLPPLAEQHRIVSKVDELMALCDQLEQQQTDNNTTHHTLVETLLGTLTTSVDNKELQENWLRTEKYFNTLFTTEASIDQLKQTTLQLAVMGKLVPQGPNDEPASLLLERIEEKRTRLVKEGIIKKQKPQSSIKETEQQFDLPSGWAIERFGNLAIIERGGSPRPIKSFLTSDPGGLNWIKISDTDIGGKYISTTAEKIIKEGLSKTQMVYPGDFLLTNSMSFGRPYITKIEGCIHDGWLRISPATLINKDYLYWLLTSPFLQKALADLAAGAVVQNLNSDKVREVAILVPPVEEQQRIAAKVDELMAICDALMVHIQDAQTTQVHLADAVVEQAVA